MFDRIFKSLSGKGRATEAARKAEARGDLVKAVELWVEAEEPGEAARVMLLRGDAEVEPRARLVHYTQAAAVAPDEAPSRRDARRKRAELIIAMNAGAAVSAVARKDVLEAAAELEAVGEGEKAAEAYALVGETDGEARALASAGEVERLEFLLSMQQARERDARKRADASAEIALLAASGRRRDALSAAEAQARARPDDLAARERAQQLAARRVLGPLARLTVRGRALPLVLGPDVVIGRTEGALVLPSSAVSRRHARIARGAAGSVFVEDLGSRNGTHLHGMPIAGKMPIGEGVELRLGGELPVRVAPSSLLPGAVDIELAGARWIAPLGDGAPLGVGSWRVELANDGWVELVSGAPPAFTGDVELAPRTTLLVGDAIADARGAEPLLRV